MARKAPSRRPAKKRSAKRSSRRQAAKVAKKTRKKTADRKRPSQLKAKSTAAKKKSKPEPKKGKGKAKPRGGEAPNNIGLVLQHVDFLTYKVEQVRKFYGDVLGFRTEQQEPDLNYLVVHVTPASSIGFMPPHPQMTGEQPPPREPTLYFIVADVDQVFAALMAKGVAFMGPPQEMPWGHRVVMTTDPEGRTVMLASKRRKE